MNKRRHPLTVISRFEWLPLLLLSCVPPVMAAEVERVHLATGDFGFVFGSERVGYWAPKVGDGLEYVVVSQADQCPDEQKKRFQAFARERYPPSTASLPRLIPYGVRSTGGYVLVGTREGGDEVVSFDCAAPRVMPYPAESRHAWKGGTSSSDGSLWMVVTPPGGGAYLTRIGVDSVTPGLLSGEFSFSTRQIGSYQNGVCVLSDKKAAMQCIDADLRVQTYPTNGPASPAEGPHAIGKKKWIAFYQKYDHLEARGLDLFGDIEDLDAERARLREIFKQTGYPIITSGYRLGVLTVGYQLIYRSEKGIFLLPPSGDAQLLYPLTRDESLRTIMSRAGTGRVLLSTPKELVLLKVPEVW